MTSFDGKLLICDCEGTMPLDGGALGKACGQAVSVYTQLCRSETHAFEAAG